MGAWDYDYIGLDDLEDVPETFNHCQECDFIVEGDYTFCPDCGSKLIEFDAKQCYEYGIDTNNVREDK
jgi:uncharacterized paraquat-inducible protein A